VRRLVLVTLCALALPAASAKAWSWPVSGTVIRPFSFDPAHPYAGGQHRGIDIAADEGAAVVAPADGTISFAGTVPGGGKTVSIVTPFGYTATLLHLGSLAVKRDAAALEGVTVVGTVGPAEDGPPYVYFGVRLTSQAQGYVDPLPLLPALPVPQAPPSADASAPPVADVAPAPSSTVPPPAVDDSQIAEPTVELPPVLTAPASDQAATPATSDAAAAPPVAKTSLPVAEPAQGSAAEVPSAATADSSVVPTPAAAPVTQATAPAAAAPLTSSGLVLLTAPVSPPALLASVQLAALGSVRPFAVRPTSALAPDIGETPAIRAESSPTHVRGRTPSRPLANAKPSLSSRHSGVEMHGTRARVEKAPVVRDALLGALCGVLVGSLLLLLKRVARQGRAKPARIMSVPVARTVEEDPRRARVAVWERSAAPRTRGRVRRAGGHLRALSPAEGQRRPDGERDGRARYARDGFGGPGRRLAA
jgi:hypothetical protein